MGRRKRSRRLETPAKHYTLDQCALFGVKGMNRLQSVLGWKVGRGSLEALADAKHAYRVWPGPRGRVVQEPNPELRAVHARIATLLRRVAPPSYRHSGVRGRSFLTNAQQHALNCPSIKTDIRGFYQSVTFAHVLTFFRREMKCAGDVAFLLAKLCCYERKHLPTGGVHSEVLAFYCARGCFEQLNERAKQRGGVMSVYVDDIMVTTPTASHTDLGWMTRLFAHRGFTLHPVKSTVYRKHQPKTITGVRIRNGHLTAPQRQHMAIKDLNAQLRDTAATTEMAAKAARSLLGHLDHVAQIEPRFKTRAVGGRARLSRLLVLPKAT